ncbi:histone deacetylase [Oceanobacter sp. 3_MG-2023]|uniref:histone deacetylase family protein n=1 Tax=Oceanobacter sp. 3_MG-2023 TaxID=3062622 RepID=UPI002732FF1A|nr:histone deacetylase [Oceanobacter sp. 3_MG-2023]MDP2504594.1 histone deacetylase [Oceanobacter sp. 3_MG-2023]
MKLPIVYHTNYSCPFPDNHRFVMSKFVRLHDHLLQQGYIHDNLYRPAAASIADLAITHSPVYLQALVDDAIEMKAWRRLGLPWSQGLIDRTLTAPNGTLLAARLALQHGMASHLAGGTHHAHYDFGSGFCLVNDLAYTALALLQRREVQRLLIFDLDVHQGDGTAALLEHEPRAFTCSIHCEKNFPFRKHRSDLDIGLGQYLDDAAYLTVVRDTFERLIHEHQPELVIYDAGVDVWEGDGLGHLNITLEGIQQRDRWVLAYCQQRGIPVVTVIGGGYDKDHQRLAERHASVVKTASILFAEQ